MPFLLLMLLGYLTICIWIYAFQGRLVYFPEREILATPGDLGLEYRDVTFETEDAVKLHGWYVPAENARGTVLFCHGNAGNISGRVPLLQILNRLGLSVFIFDYRGYGLSEGSPSEEGTYRDIFAALAHLEEGEGIPASEVIVLGRSIGGGVAIRLAEARELGGLIVDSSFTSATDLGQKVYWWLPIRFLARYRYDSLSRVGAIRCPSLFIHSVDDDVVPIAMGRRLYEAAPEPKQFLEIRGGHADSFLVSADLYRKGIEAFLDSLEAGKAS
jgi:fermentation-respiration switch protein FrsA (DUF1100 family)